MRCGTRTRSSGSSTSSARPTSSTAPSWGSSRTRRRTGRRAARCRRSTERVLGEASKLFTTSRNNQQRLESSTGLVAEVLPHPPQELSYRCEDYGDFVLSVGRLDRAKRVDLLIEAAAESSFSVVVAGRRAGPRPAGGAGGTAEPRRPRPLPRSRQRGRARRPVRALPGRLLRAGGRGLRDGSLRGVPRGQAGGDDGRRRRPARGRGRPRDRASSASRARPLWPTRASGCASISTRRAPSAVPATRSPTRSPGTAPSSGSCREGRLLLAASARALGHRGLQRASSACAQAPVRHRGCTAAPARLAQDRRRALPRREQPAGARLDRGRVAPAPRRRRPPRPRPPPPGCRADARARKRRRVRRRDGARRRGGGAPARRARRRGARPAAVGDGPGALPARRRDPRPRHRADRPLALHRARRAGGGLHGPYLARPARRGSGAGRPAGADRRRAGHRLLRPRQSGQTDPAAPARLRAAPRAASGREARPRGSDRAGVRARPADRRPRTGGRCCQRGLRRRPAACGR